MWIRREQGIYKPVVIVERSLRCMGGEWVYLFTLNMKMRPKDEWMPLHSVSTASMVILAYCKLVHKYTFCRAYVVKFCTTIPDWVAMVA